MNLKMICCLLTLCAIQAHAQSGVMVPLETRSWDNIRSGLNSGEKIINPTNLATQGLVVDFVLPMEGDRVGSEGQPLIEPNVTMEDGKVRDVLYQCSMNNTCWAYDANTSDDLWMKKLGVPVNGGPSIDMHLINDHWGALATPVISAKYMQMFVVFWTSQDGTPGKGVYKLAILDMRSGDIEKIVDLSTLTYQPTNGGPLQHFNSIMRKCRSSLTLANVAGTDTVEFNCGTVSETSSGASGVMVAYDIASGITSMMTTTAGDGGGIWMGGQGSIFANGKFYVLTGNGSFNGKDNFGESALAVQYTPPAVVPLMKPLSPAEAQMQLYNMNVAPSSDGTPTSAVITSMETITPSTWNIPDWLTPWTDEGRIGGDVTGAGQMKAVQAKLSGISLPTEQAKDDDGGMPNNGMKMRNMVHTHVLKTNLASITVPNRDDKVNVAVFSDQDLGSSQMRYVPPPYNALIAIGKDGEWYDIDASNMGRTQPSDFLNVKANVCAKLLQYPGWATNYFGDVDTCPQDPVALDLMPNVGHNGAAVTIHQHSTPVLLSDAKGTPHIFIWGENSPLRHFIMNPDKTLTFVNQSTMVASGNCGNPGERCGNSPGGMPGGFGSASASDAKGTNAILWYVIPYGDANAEVTNGRLLAFDPFNAAPDGSMKVLWDSQNAGIPFLMNKFNIPVVDGGKVFLPTYQDETLVLRLK